jgi:hypothetical protein
MKRIVVKLTGMPFDPTYEIDDDTISIRTGTSARKPSFRAGQDYGHHASPSRPADRGADEASAVHSRLRPDLMMLGRGRRPNIISAGLSYYSCFATTRA